MKGGKIDRFLNISRSCILIISGDAGTGGVAGTKKT
jgi:hypothetical protein